MKRITRGSVPKVDHSAAGEAEAIEQGLHHVVVGVGVNADVTALGEAPVETMRPHSADATVGSQPVNHAVGSVVEPGTVYLGVSGLGSDSKPESGDDVSVGLAYILLPGVDTRRDEFARRIAPHPLNSITARTHKATGGIV